MTARKDDGAAAAQAATSKVTVSVSAALDGGLIQTSSGRRQQRVDRFYRLVWSSLACS